MSYLILSRNGEESFNKFWSPDPDHLRGGPIHGYTPSCVNNLSQPEKYFVSSAHGETNRSKCTNPAIPSGSGSNKAIQGLLSHRIYSQIISITQA